MERVFFCRGCGKLASPEWTYCPFCGSGLRNRGSFASAMEEPFVKLDRLSKNAVGERLSRMKRDLEELERELDAMLAERLNDESISAEN
jgi:hypothetical protein